MVRDTLLNNINIYGLNNFIEALQLQLETEVEYTSHEIKDKLLFYIEKYKLSDKNTRRPAFNTPRGKGPFRRESKDFSKGKDKKKRINALGVEVDEEEIEDQPILPEDQVLIEEEEEEMLDNIGESQDNSDIKDKDEVNNEGV